MFKPALLCTNCMIVLLCFTLGLTRADAQQQAPLTLLPVPQSVVSAPGQLNLPSGIRIDFQGYTEPRLKDAGTRFLDVLSRLTGTPALPSQPSKQVLLIVKTAGPSAPVQQLGEDESYHLQVTSQQILLSAPNPLGILHGLQTLLQLVHTTPQGFALSAVTIDDKPRFPWRGLMIDSSRHFMPLSIIRQNLDGMEAVKLNVFHWHLSDDQGFRVESKAFPLLHEKGSDGLYYTQDQVREVLAYARARGIRVIPEFDMPCHTTSWFVGYPQLASGSGPYQIERDWGVFDPAIDPTRESTFKFLDRFLDEMTSLFPDAYFHIGGDECNGKEWDANAHIKQYMQAHHLKDNAALQAEFTARVQKLVADHHKIMVGWDEVLQPDTPHDVVIQSWRGPRSLAEAARSGYRGILSAGYYLDLNHSAADHYLADPLDSGKITLTAAQEANILGGEAAMWTEYVTPENVNMRIWPRAAVVAERLWSPRAVKDTDSMYVRLDVLAQKLAFYNLPVQATEAQELKRLSGYADPSALQVLGSAVQPTRDYVRETLNHYNVFFPLNRLVDSIPAESEKARIFHQLAERIASGKATPAEWEQARQWLTMWRDNDARLQPSLKNSDLTAELVPVSHHLADVAEIGLAALSNLQKKASVSKKSQQQQIVLLQHLEQPEAALLDQIAPAVERLVRSVGH
ncbi:MAG: family 20 glycosylhydrolase [Acidobacteriaceae bacterium]|nr:family 20 glycosylhydrolase [Acidobacteriaceae bacterium]